MTNRLFILILIFTFSCLASKSQVKNNCDSIFYSSFYNFVNYDDSVGYTLSYNIDSNYFNCLDDTVAIINFLVSNRFVMENSEAINDIGRRGLSITPKSYLAHHTNHSKIKPSLDSSYTAISNWRAQMVGNGSQVFQNASLDVLKLYFISALFYKDFQFRNEIVLNRRLKIVETYTDYELGTDYPKGTLFEVKIRNKKIVKMAFNSYKKWIKELNIQGIKKLRQENIDPLYYTRNIKWRDKKFDPFNGIELTN